MSYSIEIVPEQQRRLLKGLSKISDQVQKNAEGIIEDTARQTQFETQRNAPVDFGFLRASVYIDYDGKVSQIKLNSGASSQKTGGTKPPSFNPASVLFNLRGTTPNKLNAIVGIGVKYGEKMEKRDQMLSSAFRKNSLKMNKKVDKLISDAVKRFNR